MTEPPFFSETLSQIPHPNLVSYPNNVNVNLNLYPTITPKPKREVSKSPIPSSLLNSNNLHPKFRSTPKPNFAPEETSTFKNIEDHVEGIKNLVEDAFNIKPKSKIPTKMMKKKIRPVYRPPGSPTPRPVLLRPTPFTPGFIKSSDRRATASPTPSPFTPVFKSSSTDRRRATASPTRRPTALPTRQPTASPTHRPTASPTRRPPTTPFAPYKAPTKTLQPYRPKPVTPKTKIPSPYSPTNIPTHPVPEPNFDRPIPVKSNSVTRLNPNYGLNQNNEHPVPVKHTPAYRPHPEPNFNRQIPAAVKSSLTGRLDSNEPNPVPVSVNRPPVNRPQQQHSYSNQNDNFGRPVPKQFENSYSSEEKYVVVPHQTKYNSDTQSFTENYATNWAEPRNDILEQDLNDITDEELIIQMAAGLELGKLK